MKRIFSLVILSTSLIFLIVSCAGSDTYEKQLEAEKELVSDFIKRNNINVITTLPANNSWGPNDYYKTDDDFYIHIVDTGEINTQVISGQLVLARYIKSTLDANPEIVINKWTTSDSPYPEDITYNLSSKSPSPGFQLAISIMKRHNSEATFILPSKLGTSVDADAVIPYFYHAKIQLTE